jgi:hypothetical protein
MTYCEKYSLLERKHNLKDSLINVPELGINIHNMKFVSDSWILLPGAKEYKCLKHDSTFSDKINFEKYEVFQHYPDILKHDDIEILENREFSYTIFQKAGSGKADSVILLFHGLNEKHWNKYLPWAEKLVALTGKTVLLFPIAFHMNRSPADWSNPHMMNNVALLRRKFSRSITNATFANAAISARIQTIPQRFFWSGLQTFYDVVKLISEIKKDKHPLINPAATIDLFSYSIGSFLSEILMMANPRNYFSDSKLFMFCGGSTLDRMSPNSKFILDSDATIAIYSFYTERLESELKLDKRIAHYFNGNHVSGTYFKSMLSYKKNKDIRENRFNELSKKIYAIALKKDDVIPPNEVINTLQGDYRNIPIKVEIMDFPFPYSHIKPFSEDNSHSEIVDSCFNQIFDSAATFLE